MTRRMVAVVESNLSGEPADTEIIFSVQGVTYHLDLTTDEAKQFNEALMPYVSVAEVVRRRGGPRPSRTGTSADVRTWARERGVPLNPTGRIPNEVWEQYEADKTRRAKSA